VCHVTGLGSGVLSADSDKHGEMLALGTQHGEVLMMKASGFGPK